MSQGCCSCDRQAPGWVEGRFFRTCCKTCAISQGRRGHDIACDIRRDGAMCPPWYWKFPHRRDGTWHEEVAGRYAEKMAMSLIGRGLAGCQIVRATRVEDSVLWARYAAKRAQLRLRGVCQAACSSTSNDLRFSARIALDDSVNEVYLFHCTTPAAAAAIVKSNFQPSVFGSFGPGVYFADNAAKSNQYATGLSADGCKVMVLCRVVLGNLVQYGSGSNGDSLTGTTNHREFIIRDTSQIYPEYLVHYKA